MGLLSITRILNLNVLIYSILENNITNYFTMYPKFQQQNY